MCFDGAFLWVGEKFLHSAENELGQFKFRFDEANPERRFSSLKSQQSTTSDRLLCALNENGDGGHCWTHYKNRVRLFSVVLDRCG